MSTPEEASEYLARTNFKSIVEWITAEAILNRPDDPVIFVKNLLEAKIDARGSQVIIFVLATSCNFTSSFSLVTSVVRRSRYYRS
jgi:hypothetical protein